MTCISFNARAAVPAVPEVPDNLSPEVSKDLLAKRDLFATRRESFLTEARAHNQRCHDVPLDSPDAGSCAAARDRLNGELAKLQQAADALKVEIGGAAGRAALAEKRRNEQMVTDLSHGNMAALPPDFPRIEEIEHSPGVEAWRRGMDASINHDWQLALAWFKTAQQKDPENAALGRAIQLAQWALDARQDAARKFTSKTSAKEPPSPTGTVQAPTDEDLKLLFPGSDEEPQSTALSSAQLPTDEDLKYLFPGYDEKKIKVMHDDMQLLFPGYIPQKNVSPVQDTSLNEVTETARHELAHELQGQAMIYIMEKKYSGAVELLDAADKLVPEVPNYRETRDLVRSWIDQDTTAREPANGRSN